MPLSISKASIHFHKPLFLIKKGQNSARLMLKIWVSRKRFHPVSAVNRRIHLLAIAINSLARDLAGNFRDSSKMF